MLLDKMGKGIVLREIIAFLYILSCLVMPLVGYEYYSRANFLAKLWVRYMPVPFETYYAYALPATAFFCLGLLMPFPAARDNEQGAGLGRLFDSIKRNLTVAKSGSLALLVIGFVTSFLIRFLPSALQYFATLIFFGSFAGLLYVYFSPSFRYKRLILIGYPLLMAVNAITSGMFTLVAYMGITVASFLIVGKKPSLLRKLVIFIFASFFFIVLQNVKHSYREFIWRNAYQGDRISLFSDLFVTNVQKGEGLFDTKTFFPIYIRANQGYNVALVMNRMPSVQPYDNGNNLMKAFASAFVPRFLWPDKPEAGGAFNMKYYTGVTIMGWSTNVGPLGEAYGSFGVVGGVVYMFLLGLLIRLVYGKIFSIANKMPLLVCWLPVIFYQVVSSAETDSLTIFNSLIKSCFFVWLIYKVNPSWFGIARPGSMPARRRELTIPGKV